MKACQFRCNKLPEIRSLCRINTIQPVDKAAVIEFAHDAAVDDLLQFDLADARVAAEHQALNVAHSFQGGMRFFFEPAASQ